jgi:hypothetical protein
VKEATTDARIRARTGTRHGDRLPVTLANGGHVTLYVADIPGYAAMKRSDRSRITSILMQKIIAGQTLYSRISESAEPVEDLPAPSRQDASNLLWFLKSKANEIAKSPYEKGALTIPDPGNRFRFYLDRMPDIYTRRSTHLPEQQLGAFKKPWFFSRIQKSAEAQAYLASHQPRGTDFYEGTSSEGDIDNPDLLLPSGMHTFLYQQVKTAGGTARLYIKMETEGARADPGTPTYSGGIQSRPLERADLEHTAAHLLNLVKKMVTGGHAKNKDLPQLREDVPKPIQKLVKKILSEFKKKDRNLYDFMLYSPDIGNIDTNMNYIYDDVITRFPEIGELLVELDFALKSSKFHLGGNPSERFGEEVVLMDSDLRGPLWSDW